MNTPALRPRQRGAILVTSLLLLVILTVLGVALMRLTNLQERMAGNTRDMNLALQGAEAGLREAERVIGAQAALPVIESYGTDATCQFCTELPVDIENADVFNWSVNATAFTGIGGLDDDPHYKIEHTAYVSDDLLSGQDPPTGRDVFTATARSTGASGQANTVLQSTYARRF